MDREAQTVAESAAIWRSLEIFLPRRQFLGAITPLKDLKRNEASLGTPLAMSPPVATAIPIPALTNVGRFMGVALGPAATPTVARFQKSVKGVAREQPEETSNDLRTLFAAVIAGLLASFRPAVAQPRPTAEGPALVATRNIARPIEPLIPQSRPVEVPTPATVAALPQLASSTPPQMALALKLDQPGREPSPEVKPAPAEPAAKRLKAAETVAPALQAVAEPGPAEAPAVRPSAPAAAPALEPRAAPEPQPAGVLLLPALPAVAFTAELWLKPGAAVEPAPKQAFEAPRAIEPPAPAAGNASPAPDVAPHETQVMPAAKATARTASVSEAAVQPAKAEPAPVMPAPDRSDGDSSGSAVQWSVAVEAREAPRPSAQVSGELPPAGFEPRRAAPAAPETDASPARAAAPASEVRPFDSRPEAVSRPAEAGTRSAAGASEAPAPDAVIERAALSSSAAGNSIELLLRAEHLGRVAVRLVERAGAIEVAVRSDSQPLRNLLTESLPSLVHTLHERGWEVARPSGGSADAGLNWWTADQHTKDRQQGEAQRRRSRLARRREEILFSLEV